MIALVILLLITVLAGLWRVILGPTRVDRLLAIQLFGTTGAAILLILAQALDLPALRDVALVLALLAAVVSAALVQFLRRVRPDEAQGAQRPGPEHPKPEHPTSEHPQPERPQEDSP